MLFTFETVASQFKNQAEYRKHISDCLKNFDLKVYRLNSMTKQQAINYYNDLKNKYELGIYQSTPTSWYQNQRRLFIWFLICYIKFAGIIALDNQQNWENLSQIFFSKNHRLLKYQYMNILKKSGRVSWKKQEDQVLLEAYQKFQKGEWNQVAKELFFSGKSYQFKSPKNCRQRWNNHLDKEIKKDPWNDEEDLEMLKVVKQLGKKWSQIAKSLNLKRTQHQIKNRYNSLMNHADIKKTQDETLDYLIGRYKNKQNNSKLNFLNTIIVVKQKDKNYLPWILKNSFEQGQQKKQHVTSGGTTLIYCGKDSQGSNVKLTNVIEEKPFGSSFLSTQIKSENCWLDAPIHHTADYHFLQDSRNFEKKLGDDFRLLQKGSFEKSEFTKSMQFFKLPKSKISQQFKNIITPNNMPQYSSMKYDFSNQIKELNQ